MSIESVMPSNHLILYCPLLLLPSIFPSNRVFSNELSFCIRWLGIGASASASVLPKSFQGWFPCVFKPYNLRKISPAEDKARCYIWMKDVLTRSVYTCRLGMGWLRRETSWCLVSIHQLKVKGASFVLFLTPTIFPSLWFPLLERLPRKFPFPLTSPLRHALHMHTPLWILVGCRELGVF